MNAPHFHLIVNHLPFVGLLFAALVLAWGLVRRSAEIEKTGLYLVVLSALFALPAFFSGEPAEETVEHSPAVAQASIESHEAAARVAVLLTGVLGIAAVAGRTLVAFRPRLSRAVAAVVLLLTLPALGVLAWTSNLGGDIRHPEIRAELAGK